MLGVGLGANVEYACCSALQVALPLPQPLPLPEPLVPYPNP